MPRTHLAVAVACLISAGGAAALATRPAAPGTSPSTAPAPLGFYAGSTHAHTSLTWSHGDQWVNAKPEGGGKKEPGIVVNADGAQHPGKGLVLKPDWQKYQGPPAEHFAAAKVNGYDFYVVTDHSQEAGFQPPAPANADWAATKRSARQATDADFVALAGYEHSENNGPGGVGHLNVINSAGYLNALAPGVDLPAFYQWLKTAPPDGEGPVVASFNHPGPHQYADWAHRDPAVTDVITLLEVINSNNKIHYEAFLNALDKGWKVSPVCGNDNHGLAGIKRQTSRTVVLATGRTKVAILEAMSCRRTYATLDKNLRCSYAVNGAIMGSTLDRPDACEVDVTVSDPDTEDPITKIDIVKDGGAVVETCKFDPPRHVVNWKTTVRDPAAKYLFVRVWTARGGDAPNPDPAKPVAWLAPVWTGR
jgi:hypothetical protein